MIPAKAFEFASCSRGRLLGISVLFAFAVALGDHLTGIEVSFSLFYLLPVSLAAWCAGHGPGFLISVLSAILWFINDYAIGGRAYSNPHADTGSPWDSSGDRQRAS